MGCAVWITGGHTKHARLMRCEPPRFMEPIDPAAEGAMKDAAGVYADCRAAVERGLAELQARTPLCGCGTWRPCVLVLTGGVHLGEVQLLENMPVVADPCMHRTSRLHNLTHSGVLAGCAGGRPGEATAGAAIGAGAPRVALTGPDAGAAGRAATICLRPAPECSGGRRFCYKLRPRLWCCQAGP